MSSHSTPGADEQFCPTCGAVIKERAELCPGCGADNDGVSSGPAEFYYCESCGEPIQSEPELCPECGVRQRSATDGGLGDANILLWAVGVLVILWGLAEITDPGASLLSSVLTGLFLIVIGSIALPPVHQRLTRLERRHTLTAFGTIKSVERYPVSRYDGRCTACDGPVEGGIRHEYAEEFAVFGIVTSTAKSGSNVYCRNCALIEGRGSSDVPGTAGTATTSPDQSESPAVEQTESSPAEDAEK